MTSSDSLLNDVALLKEEIEKIKERNRRVEGDKAWETSKTRTVFISVITFCIVYVFMTFGNANNPFLSSLVAVAAYWLSTESYGLLKKWWLRKRKA